MERNWKYILSPYELALKELKVKLRGQRAQYRLMDRPSPIEFVTGRLKPVESIIDKARHRRMSLDDLEAEMEDIVGLRVMCPFIEDIYEVVELIKAREDLTVIEERDYVTYKKQSGYRSYHLICRYPIERVEGRRFVLVEIQIRTLAMNFWASIEHSLHYKKDDQHYPEDILNRLQSVAESVSALDEEMSLLRREIKAIDERHPKEEFDDDAN